MAIIREARKPNTRACYASKWKRFVHYAIAQKFDPYTPSVQDIICYLLHLQKSGLAYTSIRIHLTAMAAYLQNRERTSLFRIPVVKAFMEGESTYNTTSTSLEP